MTFPDLTSFNQIARVQIKYENAKENNELSISSRFAKLKNIVSKFSPDLRAEKKELSCRIRFPEWKKMKFAGR